jgi:hypothetical protein
MAKLVKFMDGKFACWSRVDLDNGEPIWISVAHSGVLVKKSKWGIMGEKLYKANAHESHLTGAALLSLYMDDGIKAEYDMMHKISNYILFAFTLAAMVSESSNQLSINLKNARESAKEHVKKSAEEMMARFDKLRKKIMTKRILIYFQNDNVGRVGAAHRIL